MSQFESGVPFSFFTSLVTAICSIEHFRAGHKGTIPYFALNKFKAWRQHFLAHFSEPPSHVTRVIFCLLFPELDNYRKYHLKEFRLAQTLAHAVPLSYSRLDSWIKVGSAGCLGHEIREALKENCTDLDVSSRLTVHEIDDLLDELASLSPNSDASIHTRYPRELRRQRHEILSALFRRLNPTDAGILVQVILKDLTPLLYPVKPGGYASELRDYNIKRVKYLRVEDAMDVWDPSGRLRWLYRTHSDMRYATEAFERKEEEVKPRVGTMIKIPKSMKLQGIKNAFNTFSARSSRVWAETKYDGERAQIHVRVKAHGVSDITIFSKSGRNSTSDRTAIHWIVRQALGLRDQASAYAGRLDCKVTTSVILDAEMVAWDTDHIDEFWRIRSLVERTAQGARFRWRPAKASCNCGPDGFSQTSLISDCAEDMCDDIHLSLVFFDIMALNDESLLGRPYSYRRSLLESVVQPIPSYCMFSERFPVDLPRALSASQEDSDTEDDETPENNPASIPMGIHAQRALEQLYRIFAWHLVERREGIMIKADESRYGEWSSPWAKLKRDYIPGYGDTLDLVLVGAIWDAERARKLGVSPAVYTTFYIGALTNADEIAQDASVKPNYHVYFVSSYGMTRRQLEDMNSRINARPTVLFSDLEAPPPRNGLISYPELEYTFKLFNELPKPHILFCEPLLAEVYGAGFDVPRGSRHYALRFPRISKVYSVTDRLASACTTLDELTDLAYAVVGRKSTKDEIDELWHRMNDNPQGNASGKRKRGPDEDEWVELLRAADEGRLKLEQRKKRVKGSFARAPTGGKNDRPSDLAINVLRSFTFSDKRDISSDTAHDPSRCMPLPSTSTSFQMQDMLAIRDAAALPTPLASPSRRVPEIIDLCSPPASPAPPTTTLPAAFQASPFLKCIQKASAIYFDLPRDRMEPRAAFKEVLDAALAYSDAYVSPNLSDFLGHCGWMPDSSPPSEQRCAYGIILSDVEGGAEIEPKDGWLKILHRLRFARKSLNEKGLAPGRARLWIFDMQTLMYEGQDFLCKHLAEL